MTTGRNVSDRTYVRPTPLEIATCWLHGLLPAQPLPPSGQSPRRVLDDVIRAALLGGPCYVTFSGGRDSSAILAVATKVARSEGLADPVPVTRRYPRFPESDETSWQEMVVDHLGLKEWIRLELDDETDLLGPAAQTSLRRHGVLWPPAVHGHHLVFELLGGGSLLTGEGGDDVLGPRRVTPLTLLRRRRAPRPHLLRWAAGSMMPTPIRRARIERTVRHDGIRSWLRPDAARLHARLVADDEAAEPLSYSDSVWAVTRKRSWDAIDVNQAHITATHGITAANPFLDARFLAALAHEGGRWGYNGRTAAMKALFSDVLPMAVLTRGTKASFNRAYTGRYTQEFARGWDGAGVDTSLVDPDRLRQAWLSDQPTMAAAMLLHSAWLTSIGEPLTGGAS